MYVYCMRCAGAGGDRVRGGPGARQPVPAAQGHTELLRQDRQEDCRPRLRNW